MARPAPGRTPRGLADRRALREVAPDAAKAPASAWTAPRDDDSPPGAAPRREQMSIDSGGTLEETVQAESQGMLAEFVTHIQARRPAGTALFPAAPTVSACPPVRSARPGAGRRSRAPAARRAELALPAPGAQGGGPGGARCRGVPPPAACVRLRASLAGTAAAEAR